MDDPAVPLFWGKNKKGMQAGEECSALGVWRRMLTYSLDDGEVVSREEAWLAARERRRQYARECLRRRRLP